MPGTREDDRRSSRKGACTHHLRPLLERVEKAEIDPSFVISHRMSLGDAPEAYAMFRGHEDGCTKVVLRP